MKPVFDWQIVQIEAFPVHGDHFDAVATVHWKYVGAVGYTVAERAGASGLHQHDRTNYVPFDALTKEQVVRWVEEIIGAERLAQMQAGIEEEIANRLQPKTVLKNTPWGG
jgi:hypothetical protein